MANLNKVLLIGRLAADPELKHTGSNIAVTSFPLAVNRRYTKPGEQSQADFIDIVCWRNNADFVCKYFQKGQAVFVSGTLQTRLWKDNQGNNRKSVEVVADEVQFAEPKRDSYGSRVSDEPAPSFVNDVDGDFQEVGDDDELPF